ncbi:hypothetical protein [Leeuwenhoekiella marinoflava]|uniref:Uncharacterized protein n=2 Tax=Leeuwenhoekiella marinoflava TaxID=988 RepID=A0A4Q0PMY9_9FLAO|nr:hypothetical protein [Leeuwenhoekiella marinoflava]RXG31803.1 hypothetical protein DSL99_1627 [Leeuwenhoekiella marinoflava]SHF04596.1 hypothetical protein SAMN02745246_01555 [Leeuwenhoekiella marinoflava DSM 3653]
MSQELNQTDYKRVTFNVKPAFKKKIKVAAARKGMSITDYMITLLKEKIN